MSFVGCWDGLVWLRVGRIDGSTDTVAVTDEGADDHSRDVLVDVTNGDNASDLDNVPSLTDILAVTDMMIVDAIDSPSFIDVLDGGVDVIVADIMEAGADVATDSVEDVSPPMDIVVLDSVDAVEARDATLSVDVPSTDASIDNIEDVPPDIFADAPCPASQAFCAGRCVNTTNDPANCGRCRGSCPTGIACVAAVCLDAMYFTPTVTHDYIVESWRSTTDGSWAAFRAAPRAEMSGLTLIVQGFRGLDGSGHPSYGLGRVALRFSVATLPLGAVVVGARLEFSALPMWGNVANTVLALVPFVPRDGVGLTLVLEDYAIEHWYMRSPLGEAPNALWEDRMAHSIPMNALGRSYLTSGSTDVWIGVITVHDRDDVAPVNTTYFLSGIYLAPSSIRLFVSYRL